MTLPPVTPMRDAKIPGSLGIGDAVEAVTKVFGAKGGCGGCKERKDALNRITATDPLDAVVERAARPNG